MASSQLNTVVKQTSMKDYTTKRDVSELSPDPSFEAIENLNKPKKKTNLMRKMSLLKNVVSLMSQIMTSLAQI